MGRIWKENKTSGNVELNHKSSFHSIDFKLAIEILQRILGFEISATNSNITNLYKGLLKGSRTIEEWLRSVELHT